ncbi:hypothetical protein LAh9_46 [Aeromonas phage LAh_9]|uniref:Uncharacterized protein n=1 Tax=Aeromonas phage LAh_9 TaxID=2591033 RepID=A0A514A0V0_9CAUD|nr:hypothetical protein HWC32_gp046 [Aeromonas phage LAh_9]QDH46876.1 hypothetical protein LAh9_46 [Aeromonas phage LAh_9]
MGSFNTACSITGTPIIPGQKVKLFVIIQNGNYRGPMVGGSLCYPWDLYNFVGLPMNAEYADYNNYEIDESDNWVVEGNLKLIKEKYVMNVVEEGKTIDDYNKYHDHMNIAKESLDWGIVEDMIHSDRLFMSNWRGKAIVHLMAIPVEVYNVLMKGPIEIWGEDAPLNGCQEFVDYKWRKFKEKLDEKSVEIEERKKALNEKVGLIITPKTGEPYVFTQEMANDLIEALCGRFAFSELEDRMDWLNDPYGIRDAFGSDEKIMKTLYEMGFLTGQFMTYNHVIRPAMLSGQEWDFKGQGEYLINLGHAIQTMRYSNEEEFPIQKVTKLETSYELKFSDLKSTAKDWFPDDQSLDDNLSAIQTDAGDQGVFEVTIDYKSEAPYMGLLYDNLSGMQGKVLKILMKE